MIAGTIPEVWQSAEKIAGRDLDVLSPAYLDRFRAANG